jgi:16S rRNA C1402 N4-methylase RsmH
MIFDESMLFPEVVCKMIVEVNKKLFIQLGEEGFSKKEADKIIKENKKEKERVTRIITNFIKAQKKTS